MAIKVFGSNTEYRKLHYWVERQVGKPNKCAVCQTTEAKIFDWANISGLYKKEVSDWRRLCRTCHMLERIGFNYCRKGHLRSIHTYFRPKGGQYCRACKRKSSL